MAYTNTFRLVQVDEPKSDNSYVITVEFTGNAGEPVVRRQRTVTTESGADIRVWAHGIVAELNSKRTSYTTVLALLGQSFTTVAPTAPTPTAKQIWLGKVSQYKQFSSLGLTGAAATDLAALLDDINATYVTGYLQ